MFLKHDRIGNTPLSHIVSRRALQILCLQQQVWPDNVRHCSKKRNCVTQFIVASRFEQCLDKHQVTQLESNRTNLAGRESPGNKMVRRIFHTCVFLGMAVHCCRPASIMQWHISTDTIRVPQKQPAESILATSDPGGQRATRLCLIA